LTYREFLDSDLTFQEWLEATVHAEVERRTAAIQPRLDALVATADAAMQTAEQRVAELEFDRLVRENAILGHVIPTAAKYFVRDAAELFIIRDGILSPRNGQTLPNDPLSPLTFEAWLQEQRKTEPYLFTKDES
jgi:hypothetical protein